MTTNDCFAVRGITMIDTLNPETGLTTIYGRTLEDVQRDYPTAECMTIDEFCRSKAEAQDTPIIWEPTTEERYHEMLEVLPPAAWLANGFLVGEPADHHAMTSQPRYDAFRVVGTDYQVSSRPLTKKEFLSEVSS